MIDPTEITEEEKHEMYCIAAIEFATNKVSEFHDFVKKTYPTLYSLIEVKGEG